MGRLSIALVLMATLARAELPPQAFGDMRAAVLRLPSGGLIAEYLFASTNDTSGFNRHGTLFGGATISNGLLWVNGGNATFWAAWSNAKPFTVSAFFRPTNGSAKQIPVSFSEYAGGGAGMWEGIYLRSNRFSCAAFQSGLGTAYADNGLYTTGEWVHVAITLTSNSNRVLYVAGLSAATLTASRTITPTRVGIGGLSRSDNPAASFYGQIDNVRIYGRELEPIEIVALSQESR